MNTIRQIVLNRRPEGIPVAADFGLAEAPMPAPVPLNSPSSTGRMEIVIANGRRVVVDRDVDLDALLRIVRGLERLE